MNELELVLDLHREGRRQGPGGTDETRLAITLSGLRGAERPRIADIGCGTGASTLVLAEELDATITAVDFLPAFLAQLKRTAESAGVGDRIETLTASMEALPFEGQSIDAIWAEGSLYNMGFENGIAAWRRFLVPGGILAVSELTWLTNARPAELERHWLHAYPEVATASAKIALLEEHGYTPIGYFPLAQRCWLDNYYRPLQSRFEAFLARHGHAEEAKSIVAAEQVEIDLYERFSAFFSYGFYVAKKNRD
jgi:ubiquinone/menaquinone biosynthesis C-methylase UbiE